MIVHSTSDLTLTLISQELEEARAIFDRIASRDLYKMVDMNIIAWADKDRYRDHFTPERIVQAAKAYAFSPSDKVKQEDLDALSAKDVIVDTAGMHYGMKDKNPLDYVKFYSKRDPNGAVVFQVSVKSSLLIVSSSRTCSKFSRYLVADARGVRRGSVEGVHQER